jgi:hypothetical protein
MKPLYRNIILVLLLAIGVWGVIKTNHLQRLAGTGDLRNRVVGARLMKDGKLPYYYHYYPGEPLRYVIERTIDTSHRRRVNNVTAPPSFHRLIMPIAEHTEHDIERGFFLLFYGMLAIMAIMVWRESRNLLLTLLFFVPFLFSDGWWHHISLEQYYFLFGFLFFITGYLLWKKQLFWAGVVFAVLVILRLNSAVFMLPFLIYFRKFKKFIAVTLACIGLYAAIAFSLPFERANWVEYFSSLKETADIHMFKKPRENRTLQLDLPEFFEGENFMELQRKGAEENIWVNPETTNVVFASRKLLHWTPSMRMLQVFFGVSVLAILLILVRKKNPLIFVGENTNKGGNPLKEGASVATEPIILTGLLFYFLSNFFSPFAVPPYQMPQWMAVAGLLIMFGAKVPRWVFALFLFAILCLCRYVPNVPGKHMLPEIIFLITTFAAIIWGKWDDAGTRRPKS